MNNLKDKNRILRRHRERRKSAGYKYLQVSMDLETQTVLEEIKKDTRFSKFKGTNTKITKRALLAYAETLRKIS